MTIAIPIYRKILLPYFLIYMYIRHVSDFHNDYACINE